MDATQLVGLAQTYFAHPDYLLVQSGICITCSYPDTINQTGQHVYHYVKLFLGVDYMPLGDPYDDIMAIFNLSNTVQSFIGSTYPGL